MLTKCIEMIQSYRLKRESPDSLEPGKFLYRVSVGGVAAIIH